MSLIIMVHLIRPSRNTLLDRENTAYFQQERYHLYCKSVPYTMLKKCYKFSLACFTGERASIFEVTGHPPIEKNRELDSREKELKKVI
jgi:hypothetical protein